MVGKTKCTYLFRFFLSFSMVADFFGEPWTSHIPSFLDRLFGIACNARHLIRSCFISHSDNDANLSATNE